MKRITSYKQAFPTGRGISQQVVRVLCLALALSAGATTASADWDYKTQISFTPLYPVSYNYTKFPVESEPEDPLRKNEIFRVAIVQDARTDKSSLPFTIDEAGQLIASSTNEVQVAWCTLSLDENEEGTKDYITVGDIAGIPDGTFDDTEAEVYVFYAYYTEGFEAKEDASVTVTNYLVAFDTRDDADTCSGEPKRVSRYAVRKMANVTSAPKQVFGKPQTEYYIVYILPRINNDPIYAPPPGLELTDDATAFDKDSWMDAVAISSYTVVDSKTGEEKVYTGKELETYLTPTFSGATVASASTALASAQVLSAEESTTTSSSTSGNLTITVSSPDLIYYTLYTGTSPQADSTWQTWEEFLTKLNEEREEKGLDISDAKAYSKFRVNEGGTAIVLPKVEGETRRFYQLRGASH